MSQKEEIAQTLNVNPRWLPPQKDAQKILEWVKDGRCHIEHQGHGEPPLLVFNDGGSMEFPTVRWKNTARGWRLVSVDTDHSDRQTTHYDVCGTVDAIEEAIEGEPELEDLQDLLDDIEHMLRRMKSRRDEYEDFVAQVREALEEDVRKKPVSPAYGHLDKLREQLAASPQQVKENREEITDRAEAVRGIAQFLEYSLRDYKDIALAVGDLYEQIRGARDWSQEEEGEADQ